MNILNKPKYKTQGFTLVEVMITVVIISVLAGLAIPSYQSSIRKSTRTEAKAALLDLMARQEQFFSENREYATNLTELGWGGDTSLNGYTNEEPGKGSYTVTVSEDSGPGVTSLVATARGGQVKDSIASFGLDSVGRKWHVPKEGSRETGWGK